MSMPKKAKKNLIAAAAVSVLAAAAALGAWFFIQYQNDRKTVDVVPLMNVTTTYWGDQVYSSGTAVSDDLQEIYAEGDRAVSDIYVQEGQQVQVGDPLVQYDKTKLELDVETQDLAVKQTEIQLEDAEDQLEKLRKTTPTSTPRPTRKPTATPRPTQAAHHHRHAPAGHPHPGTHPGAGGNLFPGPHALPCPHGAARRREPLPTPGRGLHPLQGQRHHRGPLCVPVHGKLHHDPGVPGEALGSGR